mmetsp:Transcript_10793/g.29332  ORF Transcript_10793/g.29332 Transcript_10793/m.29332 type:complete len:232 (+) Transcript_10793:847-1542(+)
MQEGGLEDPTHARSHASILAEHAPDQGYQLVRVHLVWRRILVLQDLAGQDHQRVGVEWVFQRRHLIQHNSKTPDIALEVVRAVLDDLRAQVVWCTDHSLGIVLCGIQDACDAKVAQLDLTRGHEKDVLGLQVAMQNLPVVHVLQSEAGLHKPLEDMRLWDELALASLYLHVHVPSIRVVHHYAETSLARHEDLLEPYDVLVVHALQEHRLLDCLVTLLWVHHGGLHLLDHT